MDFNDPNIVRARNLLNEWVQEINEVGMISTDRAYAKDLCIQYLESRIVAECLIDLLAREFTRDAHD